MKRVSEQPPLTGRDEHGPRSSVLSLVSFSMTAAVTDGSDKRSADLSRERMEELLEAYLEVYGRRLRINEALEVRHNPDLDVRPFKMRLPIFGPIRNRGGTTYFDDKPHLRQLAELHADAYQLAPLFGNVEGYQREVLFEDIPLRKDGDPYTVHDVETLADDIKDAFDDQATELRRHPLIFLGPSRIISSLKPDPIRGDLEGIQSLRALSQDLRFLMPPRAPKDRLYVFPSTTRLAHLEVRPPVGEVEFGSPVREVDRFLIEAEARNRLRVRNRELVEGFAIEDPEEDS